MSDKTKELLKFALEQKPNAFKEKFDEILLGLVVQKTDEIKSDMTASAFEESADPEEDDLDIEDEDLDDFDLDDEDLDDLDIEDEDLDFSDEDEDSFNEEGPAIEEGLGDRGKKLVKKLVAKGEEVFAKGKEGMEKEIARSQDNRRAEKTYRARQ